MTAAVVDLVIDKGGTFKKNITWLMSDGVTPYPLVGFTAKMQIRQTYYPEGTEVFEELTTENGGIEIDVPTAKITLFISAEDTALIDWNNAVYDLDMIDESQTPTYIKKLIKGSVTVEPEVTV